MFVFKHPKYYTELRKRNKSDQGLKQQASSSEGSSENLRSSKPQAPSIKLSNQPEQATSHKLQAPSNKRQA
jgi:hypothetical protein